MILTRLEITQLRNLQSVSFSPHPLLNIITGANGSGKTSVLEAIFLLGMGRSFRSGRVRRLINDQSSSCTVFARLGDGGQVGIQRQLNGESLLKMDGRLQVNQAEIAKRLPLTLLDPSASDLLDDGSKPRRAQLDWGVFHVEHNFYPAWQRYQRALKQRNFLLRSGSIPGPEVDAWDAELTQSAQLLHTYRSAYLQRWQPSWQRLIAAFLPAVEGLTLDYVPGWDAHQTLSQTLREWWARDAEKGFTQQGPHRADLRIRLGTAPADEVLSRGQKKLVICALKLSQAMVLSEDGVACVLLIDDLPSELDSEARERLMSYLAEAGAQVFVTAIEAEAILPAATQTGQSFKVFHVEHGRLEEA